MLEIEIHFNKDLFEARIKDRVIKHGVYFDFDFGFDFNRSIVKNLHSFNLCTHKNDLRNFAEYFNGFVRSFNYNEVKNCEIKFDGLTFIIRSTKKLEDLKYSHPLAMSKAQKFLSHNSKNILDKYFHGNIAALNILETTCSLIDEEEN